MTPTVHYRSTYDIRSACRMPGKASSRESEVTCPRCLDAIDRYKSTYGGEGNFEPKDDMVGTARVKREGTVKIKLGTLKRLIREAADTMLMSADEAEDFITKQHPDATAKAAIVDQNTGEIYVDVGEEYGSSSFHPDDVARSSWANFESDRERAEEETHRTEEDAEWDSEQQLRGKQLEDSWRQAVDDFAESWSSFTNEVDDIEPEDAAPDAAETFFHEYPQDWKKWARHLRVTRATLKNIIAERVYEAMVGGRGPKARREFEDL